MLYALINDNNVDLNPRSDHKKAIQIHPG